MVALLIGALCAYGMAYKYLPAKDREKSIARAISSCGMILLVTGAGGSFGAVIRATGLGALLEAILGNTSQAVVPALLITFFIGFIFRISLGSGTAAAITAATIIAPVLASLPIHPVYVALAALSGGMTFPHVNDSGFWVMSNLGGYNVKGGIKLYSIPLLTASIFVFIITLIFAVVLPMA
jgi:H+/gluconate symporter-like permease